MSKLLHNPKSHSPAVYIPCWLSQVPIKLLSLGSKMTYGRLSQWSNEKGIVYRSSRQLGEEIGVSKDSIDKYLKELRDVELIGTYHPQAGGVNYFEFYDHPWMHEPINENLVYKQDIRHPSPDLTIPLVRSYDTPSPDLTIINKKEIKKIKEKTIQAPVGSRVGSSFGIKEMLSDNPLNIPENILSDWLIVRNAKRAKITRTAWKQVIGNLLQLKDKGLTPLFCFTTAVARGWVGIEVRFYNEYLENKIAANRFTTNEERHSNEAKIRERELKAQEDKRIELEAANGFKQTLVDIKTNMGFSAAKQKDEEEMKRLGLSANEYYAQILKKTKTA